MKIIQLISTKLLSHYKHRNQTVKTCAMFDVKDKVAIITGGVSGIGFETAKLLLRQGLKGVTLADVNETLAVKALKEIDEEFGANKAVFVLTDVSKKESFKGAFDKTIEVFKNLDILINNAAIVDDVNWERQIAIDLHGVIIGTLLALDEYIPKYKSATEGIVINIGSIGGLIGQPALPIYSATKYGVIGFSRSLGDEAHYATQKVKIITLCPGGTSTPIGVSLEQKTLGPRYVAALSVLRNYEEFPVQKPTSVANCISKVIQNGKNGAVYIAEGGQDPYEYVYPDRKSFVSNTI